VIGCSVIQSQTVGHSVNRVTHDHGNGRQPNMEHGRHGQGVVL